MDVCLDCDSPYHYRCSTRRRYFTSKDRRAPGPSILPDDVKRDRRERDQLREILRESLTPTEICETVPSTTETEEITT